MELIAPAKNLQKLSVRAIEELFPELHGWGRAVDLNESGIPGDQIAVWLLKNGVLQPDNIGESSILYQSGNASTWATTAVWGFERNAVTIAIDTALGGGVLFIGETPRYLTWAAWMNMAAINVDYLFVGVKGIAGYSTDQTASATKIRKYLNSVDQELFISDIFNGLDTNGFTFANPPVAIDQDGKLRVSPAGVLAISGGFCADEIAEGATLGPELAVGDWTFSGPSGSGVNGNVTIDSSISAGNVNISLALLDASYIRSLIKAEITIVELPGSTGDGIRFDSISPNSTALKAGTYTFEAPCDHPSIVFYAFIGFKGNVTISVKKVIPVWQERTPAPTKKTIRTLTGSKTVYADIDPTIWRRAKIEPTRTNKCICRKINPVGTTNISNSGDAAAVLSVVDDSTALAAAGLDKVCTSGKVYKLDNSAGIAAAFAFSDGSTGNTNKHSVFVFVRVSGGTATLQGMGNPPTPNTSSSSYIQLKAENITPAGTTNRLTIGASAGAVVYFILPQLEEGAFVTAPIITAADPLATITRTGTAITKPTANVLADQNIALYMRFSMMSVGQVAKLWSSYTDANNCLCLETTATALLLKKIVAGVTTSVSLSHTHAVNVPIELLAIQSDMGMAAKFRTYTGGAWSAWSAYVDDATADGKAAAVIAATMELGAANSTAHMSGNVQLFAPIQLGSRASLADYKAIAEQEVNKINA